MKTSAEPTPNWNDLIEPFNTTVAIVNATNELVLAAVAKVKETGDTSDIALLGDGSNKLKTLIQKLEAIKPLTLKNKPVNENDYQEYYNTSVNLSNLTADIQSIVDDHLLPIIEK